MTEVLSERMSNKHRLPEKICPVCQRPFRWRKKWERDWDNVRYCSERCRRSASPGDRQACDSGSRTSAGKA